MAKTKLTSEEARLKKREYDKRRREAMKNNPELSRKLKEDERRKYLNKKAKKQVKVVADMSKREHRIKKKQWKINSRSYRRNLKKTIALEQHLLENSPPNSEYDEVLQLPNNNLNHQLQNISERKVMGRKKVRRDRTKLFRENIRLKKEIKLVKARAERYKKRYQSLNKRNENSPKTPKSKVEKMLGKEKVSPAVRKKLLFGEVVNEELKQSYQSLKRSQRGRQMFYTVMKGKILKKYRLLNVAHGSFLRYKSVKTTTSNMNIEHDKLTYSFKCQRRGNFLANEKRSDVVRFYDRDDNSKLLPGKRDCLTKNKEKRQKRLLCDTLKALYIKFLSEVEYYVGYTLFVKLKPYNVVSPTVEDRNTCACLLHVNTASVISKLHDEHVFEYKRGSHLLTTLCCSRESESCLNRTCVNCRDKEIVYNITDENKLIKFKKWVSEKQRIKTKDKEKDIRKPVKKEVVQTLKSLVSDFATTILPKYIDHVKKKNHQYKVLTNVKNSLDKNSAYIHIDFSENYACKYNEEIQAVHFGGGREQLSLHTGVLYIVNVAEPNAETLNVSTKSFCSVSKSLRHDSAAVWAHLEPIFKWAYELNPNLKTIHIQSDGVVTQYKNKTMFYVIANKLHAFLPITSLFTWNYSVSAHGKGAPDGVGGTLKRTADKLVAQGEDIENLPKFISLLKDRCNGIELFEVLEEDIKRTDDLVQVKNLTPFPGTLKVHQVLNNTSLSEIQFRSLSCFEDKCSKENCEHYHLGCQSKITRPIEGETEVDNPAEDELCVSKEDESAADSDTPNRDPSNIQAGIFVLAKVKDDGNPNIDYKYVAVCNGELDDNGEVEVMFFRCSGNKRCFKSMEDDVAFIHFTDIVCVLPPPNLLVAGDRISYKFDDFVDVNEKTYT